MLTTILLLTVALLYLAVLIARHRDRANTRLNAAVQAIQALLWTVIAADNWAESHTALRIAYLVIILLSLLAAVQSASGRK